MFKTTLLALLVLFCTSCAQVQAQKLRTDQKAFEEEDTYILYALHAKESQDFNAAATLFDALYAKSGKKEYFYQVLESYILAKEYETLLTKAQTLPSSLSEDAKVVRFKIVALYELERLKQAEELAMSLAEKTQVSDDYLLVADVLVKGKRHELALRYLESAYADEYNENILDKMAIILYVNLKKEKDALALLESHSRVHGISELIASRLLGFYSNQNDIDGLLATYKRLYLLNKDEEIAKKIVQIYTYKRDYMSLTSFLEEAKSDDALLLQLYSAAKNYAKAYPLADTLYEQTADMSYLGQSAIYEYESAQTPKPQAVLQSVMKKLKTVVQSDENPMYLNYLGYLLIDHSIDIKKGMEYIQEVLKVEPDSAYYLDSLAWGYYKLGACEKARKIIKRAQTLPGGDHAEVIEHVKKIEQCVQNQKKGKK